MMSSIIFWLDKFSSSIPIDREPIAVKRNSLSGGKVKFKKESFACRWRRGIFVDLSHKSVENNVHENVVVAVSLKFTNVISFSPSSVVDLSIADFNLSSSPPSISVLEDLPSFSNISSFKIGTDCVVVFTNLLIRAV